MKNTVKILFFALLVVAVLLIVPTVCNAAEINVPSDDTATLYDAVALEEIHISQILQLQSKFQICLLFHLKYHLVEL